MVQSSSSRPHAAPYDANYELKRQIICTLPPQSQYTMVEKEQRVFLIQYLGQVGTSMPSYTTHLLPEQVPGI